MALALKKKIYDTLGYSSDITMGPDELRLLREIVSQQYLDVIASHYPKLEQQFQGKGMEFYHELSPLVDHSYIWPKLNRCLPQESCNKIKEMSFYKKIDKIFGPFSLGRVVYEKEAQHDRDEMYWRIVRPGEPTDVGTLHADAWFHLAMNVRERCFPKGAHALKIWIPLYVEPGKNGLEIIENSHKEKTKWDYRIEEIENTSKPRLNVADESCIQKKLLKTPPGSVVIFNEDLVHVGALNQGQTTRVSLEITLIKTSC